MKRVIATYDKDSKKSPQFLINPGQEVVGTINVPERKEIPKVPWKSRSKGSRVREP